MRADNEELKEILEQYKDSLEEDYSYFLESLGADGTIKLCEYFGGCQIYVPSKKRLLKFPIERHVVKKFNGINGYKLCSDYGISNRRLKQILKEEIQK